MKIKKGDNVQIILGKDRGKKGTVEFVNGKDKKVFVGGANLYKRHVRKQGTIEGGIIDLPKPLDISNVSLVCPNCKKLTRVGYSILDKKRSECVKSAKRRLNNKNLLIAEP